MSVAVIKLGVGNTASVLFALERLGAKAVLSDDPAIVADAERIILPGVGAAGPAMRVLGDAGLRDVLLRFERPLLGICLGQQLLYQHSEEGDAQGLGLLAGNVTALPSTKAMPIPHMGWSPLHIEQAHPLLEGVASGAYVYFVHSFACPTDENAIATATYVRPFAAAVAKDNVLGCQFHPERSGAVGARILANFLSLPC